MRKLLFCKQFVFRRRELKDRNSRPNIVKKDTWGRYEKRVLGMLVRALELMQSAGTSAQNETELNRELYGYLMQALDEIRARHDDTSNLLPWAECKNQAHPDDPERVPRENKVPDFQWGYYDDLAPPDRARRGFVLECKRLGTPPRGDWILNVNYINHGVLRFVNEEHGYAKGEGAGAMIGYVQSMEFEGIFIEVNRAAAVETLPHLTLTGEWKVSGTNHLEHTLTRAFPARSFKLRHLWIDLRNSYA
jgi:hypothetical protein